jgi:hypothetical protein
MPPPRIGRCPCAASRPSQSSAHSPKRPGQTPTRPPPRIGCCPRAASRPSQSSAGPHYASPSYRTLSLCSKPSQPVFCPLSKAPRPNSPWLPTTHKQRTVRARFLLEFASAQQVTRSSFAFHTHPNPKTLCTAPGHPRSRRNTPCPAPKPHAQGSEAFPNRPGQTCRSFLPRTNLCSKQSAQDPRSSPHCKSHVQASLSTPSPPKASRPNSPRFPTTHKLITNSPRKILVRVCVASHTVKLRVSLAKPAAASYRAQTCVANSPRRIPARARTASHTSRLRFLHLAHPKRPGQIHRGSPPRTKPYNEQSA